jgi:6,7-dimethyl-8-ribityllumazine synthase
VTGTGRPELGPPDGSGLRIGIAAARWHPDITDSLLDRAVAAAKDCGTSEATVVRVPGAAELPVVAAALVAEHDAVICLGAVIRGGTPHFEYLCQAVSYGLARVALDTGTPVGNGVLTCDTADQARDRCGLPGSAEDKGYDAVLAAVETALALRGLGTAASSG